jgi:hypothetical protein
MYRGGMHKMVSTAYTTYLMSNYTYLHTSILLTCHAPSSPYYLNLFSNPLTSLVQAQP